MSEKSIFVYSNSIFLICVALNRVLYIPQNVLEGYNGTVFAYGQTGERLIA